MQIINKIKILLDIGFQLSLEHLYGFTFFFFALIEVLLHVIGFFGQILKEIKMKI